MTVDLEQLIRQKAPDKARYIPQCAFALLRRLFHQDYCNEFLRRDTKGVEFCFGVLDYIGVNINVEGFDNVPWDTEKPLVFVCNHPLGAIDGLALLGTLARQTQDHVKCIVRSELLEFDAIRQYCIPINKSGRQARDLPQQVDKAFNGSDHVMLFPAGICSREINGVVRDIPWRKFFVNKCRQWQRDIVPVHFIGQNSPRFYAIDRWTKRLHIKANIAQLFLADEMVRTSGKTFTMRFGKPIPYTTFDNTRQPQQWAQWVQQQVESL
ncbi:MAG: 1-acyl-sn-glycerol-3-phosphate acyltransferase [Bacteroidaceae bacterium]|nr:1-acyl-sn-glycerol-3-phosphate acyltransferase [Bacteroidaceae bacterium]